MHIPSPPPLPGRAASATGTWGKVAAAAVVVGAVAVEEGLRLNEQRVARREQQAADNRPPVPELGNETSPPPERERAVDISVIMRQGVSDEKRRYPSSVSL